MKKIILILVCVMMCEFTVNGANAKYKATSPELASAIKMYKAKDYAQSYTILQKVISKDTSNALAYYYMGMTSSRMGKKDEAIENYSKAISLSPNGKVGLYAQKGKRCLEDSANCHEVTKEQSELDRFIYGQYGNGFSEEALKVHERERIEEMKREMNRNNDIAPQKFKEYRDFSSEVPTNDEIVKAMRILQKAGFNNGFGGNYNPEYALMTGNYNNNNEYEMLNMLLGNKNGNVNINPQLIHSMLSSQMSSGF